MAQEKKKNPLPNSRAAPKQDVNSAISFFCRLLRLNFKAMHRKQPELLPDFEAGDICGWLSSPPDDSGNALIM